MKLRKVEGGPRNSDRWLSLVRSEKDGPDEWEAEALLG